MADNLTIITDPTGKFEDWIEIYNYGDEPVDIGGLYFTDDLNDPKKYRMPVGNDSTIIQPKAYLLLWADDDWEEGIQHIEFKLSRKGEQLAIFDSEGVNLIDSVTFSNMAPDQSYGRISDNNSQWVIQKFPTPKSPNN